MDEALIDISILIRIINTDGPLVPDGGSRMISPNGDCNFLVLIGDDWIPDWEIEREPTVHSWGMSGWID